MCDEVDLEVSNFLANSHSDKFGYNCSFARATAESTSIRKPLAFIGAVEEEEERGPFEHCACAKFSGAISRSHKDLLVYYIFQSVPQ